MTVANDYPQQHTPTSAPPASVAPDERQSMAAYLMEAPLDEAMRVWSAEPKPAPLKHTVWTHEFMALGHHDIACPACFDRPALLSRDVTPGRYRQRILPCEPCRRAGWSLLKLPLWLRWFIRHDAPSSPAPVEA